MGCNAYHAVAITFCAVTLAMFFVTVGTPAMIQGCMNMQDAMKSLSKSGARSEMKHELGDPSLGDVDLANGVTPSIPSGLGSLSMCMSQGLTRQSISVAGISVAFSSDPNSMHGYMYVAAGLLSISVILCIAALIILSMATCGDSGSYEAKNKSGSRTRTAMILLGVTAVLALIGMMAYSIGSKDELDNPQNFIISFGQRSMNALGGAGQDPFGSNRGKRNAMEDSLKEEMAMFKNLEIKYGYSFITGWISVVFAIISLLLAGLSRYQLIQQPYPSSSVKF